ncbi:MAG: hypothetical protein AB7U38_13820 [Hyphomicrobiales bacterium]
MTSRTAPGMVAPMPMRSPIPYRRRGLRHLRIWISLCLARRRERRALARLDRRLLEDVGLTSGDAREESRKPCWKP